MTYLIVLDPQSVTSRCYASKGPDGTWFGQPCLVCTSMDASHPLYLTWQCSARSHMREAHLSSACIFHMRQSHSSSRMAATRGASRDSAQSRPDAPKVIVTDLTVASVSPACGRFAFAAAAASWDPIQSGSLPPAPP